MKLPHHIAKDFFYRTVRMAEQVKTSSGFLHRGRCPLCNDWKKRAYIKDYSTFYNVYCHNCGYSHRLEVFLKDNFPDEYKKLKPYILESIKDGSAFIKPSICNQQIIHMMTDEQVHYKLINYLPNVSFNILEEQVNSRFEKYRAFCMKYLLDRRIPESIFRDFICIHSGIMAGYVGIPFYDKMKKNLIHVQGRLVLPNKKVNKQEKYLFIKDTKNGIELENKPLWGTWRVDSSKDVVICEGTLDACAFENGIATCGATMSDNFLKKVIAKYPKRIWCVDNYWLDVAGRNLTNRLLELGERCFIIPKDMVNEKDANDIIKRVFVDKQYIPMEFLNKNVYDGKTGLMKLKIMI